jgi:hypothetical protein
MNAICAAAAPNSIFALPPLSGRLHRAQGNFQHRCHVGERHLLLKVQRQHRAARRAQRGALEQFEDGACARVVGPDDVRRGKVVERGLIDHRLRPAFPLLQMTKGCPAGDAERPGAKQVRPLEPVELASDDEQHVLQDVVGFVASDQPGDVAAQHRLHTAQQQLQRLAILALRPQNPLRFLNWSRQCSLRGRDPRKGSMGYTRRRHSEPKRGPVDRSRL